MQKGAGVYPPIFDRWTGLSEQILLDEVVRLVFPIDICRIKSNPSADIIEVLAGLDDVDAVFTELVTCLDQAIRDGRTSTMSLMHGLI